MLDQLERYAERLAPYTELRLHNNHQAIVTMVGGTLITNRPRPRSAACRPARTRTARSASPRCRR